MESSKKFYLSKTFWLNLIALVALMVPAVQEIVAKDPEIPAQALVLMNLVLRLISKDKLVIS